MVASDGLINVKKEPGMETMQQSSTSSAVPLFPKPSTKPTTTTAAVSSVTPSGTPVAQAGAAAAAAIAMSSDSVSSGLGDASIFNGFAGMGGFFNAAAFAAAAAAAFPNGGITAAKGFAPKDSTKSLVGLASKVTDNPPTSTPSMKRRKRGRAEERPNVKPGDTSAAAPLMTKVETVSPQPMNTALAPADGVTEISAVGTAAAASAMGGGGIAWIPGMMNVLTPNPFGGEISNQERKERRKIRNRMSAQQHRERQRQRVDALEDCLGERDAEIVKLKDQVSALTTKNERLTARVLQLEAGQFPDLQDVLEGMGDDDITQEIPLSHPLPPSTPLGNPATSEVPSSEAAAGKAQAASAAAAAAAAASTSAAGNDVGVRSDLEGDFTDGGGVTTDPAHSSESSDSEDLSPVLTLDNRSGQPSTPPPSPDHGSRSYARVETEEQAHDPNQEWLAMFSKRSETAAAGGGDSSVMMSSCSTATVPSTAPPGSHISVSGMADTGWRKIMEVDAGGGGIAGMESCVPGGAGAGQQTATTGSTTSPTNLGTPADGNDLDVDDVIGDADDLGLDMEIFDFDHSVSGGGGDIGGGPHEDELTMAALDPMEVDALLLSTSGPVDGGNSLSISEAVVIAEERRGDLEEGSSMPHADADAATSRSVDSARGTGAVSGAAGLPGTATLSREQQSGGAGGGARVQSSGMSSGREEGVVREMMTRGGRVASTVAAGMVGAMCLAGVVINSGPSPGGDGSIAGTGMVVSPSGTSVRGGNAGRRVLSSALEEDDEESDYLNVTENVSSWVFHPVETEPWRWRATVARERRAPWVWEKALNLFADSSMASEDMCGNERSSRAHSQDGVLSRSQGVDAAAAGDLESGLIWSDDLILDDDAAAAAFEVYPPIAPPDEIENEAANEASFSENSRKDLAADVRVVTDGFSSPEEGKISGKELDLYRIHPARPFYNARGDLGGDGRGGADMRRGGRGGIGVGEGRAGGRSQNPMSHRSSYLFCSEAHGMMSGGMIDHATKAAYDHHHPGAAHPCPCPVESRRSDGEFKVNVMGRLDHAQLQQQQLLRRLLASDDSPAAAAAAAEVADRNRDDAGSMALVSSMTEGIVFGSDMRDGGTAREGLGSSRARRRGPAPIHLMDGLDGSRGFHQHAGRLENSQFLTVLVPSSSLDWGASSLAVQSALNGTTAASDEGASESAWVEIECQILKARVVQDVTFPS